MVGKCVGEGVGWRAGVSSWLSLGGTGQHAGLVNGCSKGRQAAGEKGSIAAPWPGPCPPP